MKCKRVAVAIEGRVVYAVRGGRRCNKIRVAVDPVSLLVDWRAPCDRFVGEARQELYIDEGSLRAVELLVG